MSINLFITESHPLKNVAWENANKLEKRKRACVTSRTPLKKLSDSNSI